MGDHPTIRLLTWDGDILEALRRLLPRGKARRGFTVEEFRASADQKVETRDTFVFVSWFNAGLPALTRAEWVGIGESHQIVFLQPDKQTTPSTAFLKSLGLANLGRVHIHHSSARGLDEEFLKRWLVSLGTSNPRNFILDTHIEGESLLVTNGAFETIRVPLSDLFGKERISSAQAKRFEIQPDGSYISWPRLDFSTGWGELEWLVSEERRAEAKRKNADFLKRYGASIRSIRREHSVAPDCVLGLSPASLREIELGRRMATVEELELLAAAHDLPLNDYLRSISGVKP